MAGEWTLCFISASLHAGHGERVAELSQNVTQAVPTGGTHQTPAPSPQCPSAGSLVLGSQELRPQPEPRGEGAPGVPRALPKPMGHMSRHDLSPASPLTLVLLCQQRSSEVMGGRRRGGPGVLSTAGWLQGNLWVQRGARWHPHHPVLEPGMPRRSRTGRRGGPIDAKAGGSAALPCLPPPRGPTKLPHA